MTTPRARTRPRATPAHPPRRGGHGGPPGAASVLALQRSAGNRAVGTIVARKPSTTKADAKASHGTAEEIAAVESWVTWIAMRGNGPKPAVTVPARYKALIDTLTSGVAADPGEVDHLDIGDSRFLLKRLRAEHDQVMPKASHLPFDLAEIALERALANLGTGPDAFKGGATQQMYGLGLAEIWTEAGDELRAAKAAGSTIPERLRTAEAEARALYDTADAGWVGHAPSTEKLVSPTDELGLVEFRKDVIAVVNDMRARRSADEARARRSEAQALQQAADRQLAELRTAMAEQRRQAFRAGATGKLRKLNDATGEITQAISETKAAAGIITSRVDQLNQLNDLFSKQGGKLINLPAVPEAFGAISGRLTKAHDMLSKALELMDILAPGKTQLDDGLRYLKGVDLALEHFAGKSANPFVTVYVNAYLGPGIKNCVKLLGDIAAQISAENRGLIAGGRPDLVNWKVEAGGEAVYGYLALLFRQGAGAPLSDGAWSYFDDHEDDLEAAVDGSMPGRANFGAWAHGHRYLLWEAFYGATPPPR